MMVKREFTTHQIRRGGTYPRLIEEMTYWANAADMEDRKRVPQCVNTLLDYLRGQGASEGVLEPLITLMDAFIDINSGLHSETFKPNKEEAAHLPHAYAREMGMGALAVSIVPRDMRKSTLKRAAEKLCVTEAKLENFRKNLSVEDDRIKSFTARLPFVVYALEAMAQQVHRPELSSELLDMMVDATEPVERPEHQWDRLQYLHKHLPDDPDYAEDVLAQLKPVPKKYRRPAEAPK